MTGVQTCALPILRRISVGGALALAAWTGFTRAAQKLKSEGSFAGFASLVSYADINGFLVTDFRTRQSDRRRIGRVTKLSIQGGDR